ncbi:microtubule binding protein [Cylindrobasidium torrendii FP15055 ss-10]|uniref:Coronin n=1 Tax=Cylindrobasidium torrendii FP15055 ss-10 TaxID=1314674 RepID=A0A0D7B8K5_9AGAR|nr:microtubule binding protein [Cylindrobasidium torrendii FP15055 ss-10]
MSRFIRPSKYRHVYGQSAKKEHALENVKVTNSAWDTNIVACSGKYISINWNASGGGAFAVLPLPSPFGPINGFPYKLPDTLPLARSHTAAVLDTDWSPHDDSLVASGGDDGKIMLWKIDSAAFEGWGEDGWVYRDFDPAWRLDASARKVGQVQWNPCAYGVLASASAGGEHTIKLWDVGHTEDAKIGLTGFGDTIQSMHWDPTGRFIAATCRDRKIRLFDPRASKEAVRQTDGHAGVKGARIVWMGEERIGTTGFSKMSERQIGVWDAGSLSNLKMLSVDQSAGVLMPFWSDNGLLFVAGKGDGNIRYYEWESDNLFGLAEHKSSDPQRGMCFLPRRSLNVSECEIARAYKIYGNAVEPIAFIVPRKSDSFQGDLYPPALAAEPTLQAGEWFSGKVAPPKLVDFANGAVFLSDGAAKPPPTPITPAVATPSTPAPEPIKKSLSTPIPEPPTPAPVSTSVSQPPPTASAPVASPSTNDSALAAENTKLKSELRDALEKIRKLEVALEAGRANARKAAEALLQST